MNDQLKVVRAEIERRLKYTIDRLDQSTCEKERQFDFGSRRAYIDLLSSIDSLPEEPDKSMEEAAEEYAHSWRKEGNKEVRELFPKTAYRAFIAGAEWQKKQSDKELSEKIAAAYQLGLANKEEQMTKDIKLAYGKVSMNPFDCSEAFEELIDKYGKDD